VDVHNLIPNFHVKRSQSTHASKYGMYRGSKVGEHQSEMHTIINETRGLRKPELVSEWV